jgi:hypothetical protein
MRTWTLTGNTYAVRSEIKAIGGRWDAGTKSWTVEGAASDKKLKKAIYALGGKGIDWSFIDSD